MENNKIKPIDTIKLDVSNVLLMVVKLQDNINELKEIQIECKELIEKITDSSDDKPIIVEKPKSKSWFY